MKGDFARVSFDPTLHYSQVFQQHGRVLLEADWNEQAHIQLHLLRTLVRDLVGPYWAAGSGFHPRDPNHEFRVAGSTLLEIDEPLVNYMARRGYTVIIGVGSTTLFMARQIFAPAMPILSFGMDPVYIKDEGKLERTLALMKALSIRIL